jgi:hypothetical protein
VENDNKVKRPTAPRLRPSRTHHIKHRRLQRHLSRGLDALRAFRAGKTDEPLRRRRLGLRFNGYIFYVLSCSPKCERHNRLHIVNLAWRLLAGLTRVKTAERPRRGSRWQLRGLKAIPGGLPPRVEG